MTLLDEHFVGYAVHWVEESRQDGAKTVKFRRTRLCTVAGGCKWCGNAPDAVWVGYIGGWEHKIRRYQIALLSPDAGRQLQSRHVPFSGLRGQRVVISREGDRAKGRMCVGTSMHPALDPLPPPFPLGPTLRTVFGCWRLPDEECEGADPFEPTPSPPPSAIDDRLPWEKGGAS